VFDSLSGGSHFLLSVETKILRDVPVRTMKACGGVVVHLHLFVTCALRGFGQLYSAPVLLSGKNAVSNQVWEAFWA
jgi:hypothetical protein